MIVFWVTLLLLHQGYTLVPVITVQLGEPATFTCVLPKKWNNEDLHWYKQSAGENLKLIVSLIKNTNPAYRPEFSASRFEVNVNKNMSSLTILKTKQEDEGMYHCAFMDWINNSWNATYLSLRERTVCCELTTTVIGGIVCLIISVIGNIVFICYRTPRAGYEQFKAPVAVQKHSSGQKSHQRDEDMKVYSAVVFTVMKTDRGAIKDAKAAERERIYAAVKTFGLD
nr:immunoglobulin superfamily protein [Sciaenops ocellatus]